MYPWLHIPANTLFSKPASLPSVRAAEQHVNTVTAPKGTACPPARCTSGCAYTQAFNNRRRRAPTFSAVIYLIRKTASPRHEIEVDTLMDYTQSLFVHAHCAYTRQSSSQLSRNKGMFQLFTDTSPITHLSTSHSVQPAYLHSTNIPIADCAN